MRLKHEMAYLALRNWFVDMVDSLESGATKESKEIGNQVLELLEETPRSSATIYEKMQDLLDAGDKVFEIENNRVYGMSDVQWNDWDKATIMVQKALKTLKEAV